MHHDDFRCTRRVFGLIGLLLLAACAHTTNEALCDGASSCAYQPDGGYRFDPKKHPERDTLVVVTLSGGGVRAAALAYGTLEALRELKGLNAGDTSLLDDVDIVSSVSGGSATAGWYALKGEPGLAPDDDTNPMWRFLHHGGSGALAWRGLNPIALGGYLLTPYQRSDVLADFFAGRLYGEQTYDAVESRYKSDPNEPFVILNATDLGHETRFPFTQNRFDLICSDLDRYRLADAVAASANFPIVFSPMGLTNFSRGCRAHDGDWLKKGPPVWIDYYKQRYSDKAKPVRSDGLLALRAARDARDLTDPVAGDDVLHLLDGGLVDNLGLRSVFELEDNAACLPGLFQRLKQPRPPAYAHIRRVLFIVVNARTHAPAGIDDTVYPPDELSTLFRVIDTPLDHTITGGQDYLTAELQAITLPSTESSKTFIPAPDGSCWTEIKNGSGPPAIWPPPLTLMSIVTIDFDLIPEKTCRDSYFQLPTTWTIDPWTIDRLIAVPRVMLARSSELKEFYNSAGIPPDAIFRDKPFPSRFSGDVCPASR
jgi:NTE family protein